MAPSRKTLRWSPPIALSGAEKFICKRMKRTGRLFAFLRRHRHELFDDDFQQELFAMYSDKPRGTLPLPPAMLAAVTLLQAYEQKSDAAAVEQAVFDRRWQMVLDCHGCDTPPFSQGALVEFRRRMIAHDLDRRLVERTVELARKTGDFGHKSLRVALDSAPLWGAGRVEDTFNLIAHALEVVVDCAAVAARKSPKLVRQQAGLQLLDGSSIKASLDIDWDDAAQQADALTRLLAEVDRLRAWVHDHVPDVEGSPPLAKALAMLAQILEQDLEPDPDGDGTRRIRRGVAKNRRISIADPEMRHGRKSKSRVINGFKRHVMLDLDTKLILGAAVRPANEPEHLAAEDLRQDAQPFGQVTELSIDRGYLASAWTRDLHDAGTPIYARPWHPRRARIFTKADFDINLQAGTVTCPAGETVAIRPSGAARFPATRCDSCALRPKCTRARQGRGRTVTMHAQEDLLVELRTLKQTPEGRASLRQRTAVEHALAHICRRQGPRARYIGARMNTFDVRRTAAVVNLHTADRFARAA